MNKTQQLNSQQTTNQSHSNPIIGQGEHSYAVNHNWAQIPEHIQPGYTHAVVEDAHGQIYIHNQSRHAVLVFDPEGNFITSFGEQFAKGAHGMVIYNEGSDQFLYFTDYELKAMVKTTLDGQTIMKIGQPDRPDLYDDDHPYLPTNCTIAPNGDIYITDGYGQSYIHHYTHDGRYLQSFGGLGDDNDQSPGHLNCPHGITIDNRGTQPLLLIADRRNDRFQYFTLEGKHHSFITGNLRKPCEAVIFDDKLYIPDLYSRITILDKNDRLITHLGDYPNAWELPDWPNIDHSLRKPGQFSSPHGLHVDAAGNIYLVEWIEDGRITKLTCQT